MSGKKKNKVIRPGRIALWLGIVIALVALILVGSLWIYLEKFGFPGEEQADPTDKTTAATEQTELIHLSAVEEVNIDLGNDLMIVDVGSYTGVYMEDGSDEVVTGILMAMVTNTSEKDVQLLNFTLSGNGQTANFSLSNLPAGASVVVLESSRMAYANGFNQAEVLNFARFAEPMSLCQDKIQISTYEQAMNIANISGEDITGDIVIYYKNSASDMFYGGITYRVRIEGGLKAGELRQIVPSHFRTGNSTIVNVVCG